MRRAEFSSSRGENPVRKVLRLSDRLCYELTYNWTNGRIWLALILFWAILVQLRLFFAIDDEFKIVLKDSSLRRVASYPSPRYLFFDTCGDDGDQLMSLLDGLAYAYEVNVTAVIPRLRANPVELKNYSIDDLIDVENLINALALNLTILRQSPVPVLRIAHSEKLDLIAFPPRQRAGILREAFDAQQVVHLACPRWTFVWSLPYHATLRRIILTALRPPKSLETLMSQMSLTARASAAGYNCLLEHTDDEWLKFCKDAEQRTDNIRIMSWKECYISPRRVLDFVARSDLNASRTLYIAGQNVSLVSSINKQLSIKTHTAASLLGDALNPGLTIRREMLDWYVCLGSNIAAVNSYSSLGFLLKETRFLLSSNSVTMYYNQDVTFCPKILCKEEQRRWHLDAALYASADDQRRTWVSELKLMGTSISGLLRVAKSCRFNFGVGWSCKTTPFTFSCSIDGKVQHMIPASLVERPMSGDYEFTWKLPFSRPGRYVAHVWAHSESIKFEMDGSPVVFEVPGMSFFLHTSEQARRSARALYLLHEELLRRYGNVSWIYPNDATFRTYPARSLDTFRDDMLTNRDVLILADSDLTSHTIEKLTLNGVKIVRWVLAQPLDPVSELHNTGGVLPLCSSHHFVGQYACAPKAWVTRPLSPRVVAASNRGTICDKSTACAKRHAVLMDQDAQEQVSAGISIEQLQAAIGDSTEFVSFSGWSSIEELMERYKRSRLALDLFVSGNEPFLFEASLFNVCPLVAYHGSARDSRDFPLPRQLFVDSGNVSNVSKMVQQMLRKCNSSTLAPMKREALAMHDRFPVQVANYFNDNVLFYVVCRTQDEEEWAVPTILALLFNYPFADIELVVRNEYYFRYDNAVLFELLGRKSFAKSITITQYNSADRNHHVRTKNLFMLNRPSAKHLTTWIYQWPVGDIALSPDLVSDNVNLYDEAMEGTDKMTAVIRRSPQTDNDAASQFFFQQDLHFDVIALHEAEAGTNSPQRLASSSVEDAASALGFLVVHEPMAGTWREGMKPTTSMCENWEQLQKHELWRSGAAFLSEEVDQAIERFARSCIEE